MCAPVVMGIMAVAGAMQAYSQIQQGKAEASNMQYQANLLDTQKMLIQRTADQNSNFAQGAAAEESKVAERNSMQVEGAQKAALAANNIGGGSATAADIAMDTFDKSKMDQLAIHYNADVKSWEYQESAKNQNWDLTNKQNQLRVAAKNAKIASQRQAIGTILSTAASMGSVGMLGGLGAGAASSGAATGGQYSMTAGRIAAGIV